MSDERVRIKLEELETLLRDQLAELDPDCLAQWNQELQAALAHAEKGDQWNWIIEKARTLNQELNLHRLKIEKEMELLKKELENQAQVQRALKAYGTTGLPGFDQMQ